MVKASTKVKKTPAKTTKKVVKKATSAPRKAKVAASTKVDYYPNRMTVAVSALAGTLLVLFAIIAVLGAN